jgi:hypothetical protein
MRVALITSDGRCGIAEHSNMLMQYVQQADPEIEFVGDPAWLDPIRYFADSPGGDPPRTDLVHLNYHRGLHSRWTPDVVSRVGRKVVITFHDTYETQPDRLPWDLLDACDAMIVHEPCDLYLSRGNKVHYWRQGVPEPNGTIGLPHRHRHVRPIVGTCGFAFPWKGFELLCDAAALVGWGVLICSHNATDAQVLDWQVRNPWVEVDRNYLSTPDLIARLSTCDATAFLYSCANSGTSGAIRLGIAAGKPLLATEGCRQFRDLMELEWGEHPGAVCWTSVDVSAVSRWLSCMPLGRFGPTVVALREQDSWRHLGKKYAALYRSLVQP